MTTDTVWGIERYPGSDLTGRIVVGGKDQPATGILDFILYLEGLWGRDVIESSFAAEIFYGGKLDNESVEDVLADTDNIMNWANSLNLPTKDTLDIVKEIAGVLYGIKLLPKNERTQAPINLWSSPASPSGFARCGYMWHGTEVKVIAKAFNRTPWYKVRGPGGGELPKAYRRIYGRAYRKLAGQEIHEGWVKASFLKEKGGA